MHGNDQNLRLRLTIECQQPLLYFSIVFFPERQSTFGNQMLSPPGRFSSGMGRGLVFRQAVPSRAVLCCADLGGAKFSVLVRGRN